MAKYIHFTEEEKRQANEADLVHFLLQQGEKSASSGREKRLALRSQYTIRGNEWYDHATDQGGYAIDFVKNSMVWHFPMR